MNKTEGGAASISREREREWENGVRRGGNLHLSEGGIRTKRHLASFRTTCEI